DSRPYATGSENADVPLPRSRSDTTAARHRRGAHRFGGPRGVRHAGSVRRPAFGTAEVIVAGGGALRRRGSLHSCGRGYGRMASQTGGATSRDEVFVQPARRTAIGGGAWRPCS